MWDSKCHTQFFPKPGSQSQARSSQARSSQPPSHSSTKKASTDLLADIGGDPFAAPQVVPAFASFPGFGGEYNPGTRTCLCRIYITAKTLVHWGPTSLCGWGQGAP